MNEQAVHAMMAYLGMLGNWAIETNCGPALTILYPLDPNDPTMRLFPVPTATAQNVRECLREALKFHEELHPEIP